MISCCVESALGSLLIQLDLRKPDDYVTLFTLLSPSLKMNNVKQILMKITKFSFSTSYKNLENFKIFKGY